MTSVTVPRCLSRLNYSRTKFSWSLLANTTQSLPTQVTIPTRPRSGRMNITAKLTSSASASPTAENVELACPVCYRPVSPNGVEGANLLAVKSNSFRCANCSRTFNSNGGIVDLTVTRTGVAPLGSSFFQIPLVAYVYERGYRDVFAAFLFPGFDEEARMAGDLLEPARGEVILDLSCGPGSFTRSFLKTGNYSTVVAADYSNAMLEQCRGFLETDAAADPSKVVLVRADAARLPFATASLAGVHAGAAIHCWPDVMTAVTEISRVLRPGGVFAASTFILPTPYGLESLLQPVRRLVAQLQLTFSWFTEAELKETMEACGLINWSSYRRGPYILFSASKPQL